MGNPRSTPSNQATGRDPADSSERISSVISDPLPDDVLEDNVQDHAVTSPDDGFGKLWRKRYWVRLEGADVAPADLIEVWQEHYSDFWPEGSKLYQPAGGLKEGDVAPIDLAMEGGARIGTGIAVVDTTDTSFTFATLEGHTLSGTITFSARDDDGVTVAEVNVLMRASDPLYEIGMPLGGHRHEDAFWESSLRAMARHFGVETQPEMRATCEDSHRKWRNASNIVDNAFLRTSANLIAKPLRRIADRVLSKGTPS